MRTRYHFYEIRSAAQTPGPDGVKRAFQAAERHDYRLFLWQDGSGRADHLQLLFGERYVEWRVGGEPVAGYTDRATPGMAAERAQGSRTLASRDQESLMLMRSLLRLSAFPPEVDVVVRRAIEPAAA